MTLERVAKRARVSITTVSRVLNGRPGPALSTVQRVLEAAEAIGHRQAPPGKRPGYRRVNQSKIRHGCVALMMLDDGFHRHSDLFVRLLEGVSQAAGDHGLELILCTPGLGGAAAGGPLPPRVARGHVDGLLLAGQHTPGPGHPTLPAVPQVWLTSQAKEDRDAVVMGNEQVGVLAARHLMGSCGKDCPLASFNPLPKHPALRRRCDAFHFTLEEAGRGGARLENRTRRFASRTTADPAEVRALGKPLFAALCDADPPIGGLFVPSDRWLAVLHPALRASGRMPDGLIGVGNETAHLLGLDPRPATIELHQELIGRRGVELLLRRIRCGSRAAAEVVQIQPEIVTPEG